MKRKELLELLDDLRPHVGEELKIVGSQAVHAVANLVPSIVERSVECDLYLPVNPEKRQFPQTEFGLESEYQARKGVHADFLGRVTVVLPNAWESRLVPIKDEDGLLKGYAAEIHDVAVSKLIARTLENAGLRQDAAIFRGWLRP